MSNQLDRELFDCIDTATNSIRVSGSGLVDAETIFTIDIEQPEVDVNALGKQLFANPGFDLDASWTKGTGWAIGSGVATKTAGTASNLAQSTVGVVATVTHVFDFEVTAYTAGTVTPTVGSTAGTAVSAVGYYHEEIVAAGTDTAFLAADASADLSVDNCTISAKRTIKNSGKVFDGPVWCENLFKYSEDFSNAAWSKTRLAIDSDTGLLSPVVDRTTGLKVPFQGLVSSVDNNNHPLVYAVSTDGNDYCFRAFFRNGAKDLIWFRNITSGSSAYIDIANLATGTLSSDVSVCFVQHNGGVEVCIQHATTNASNSIVIYPAVADGNATFAGDASTIDTYIMGAQLFKGTLADASIFPYWKTTTAAETGTHRYLAQPETLAERRQRLGLLERVVNDAPSGIWETPTTGYEYLDGFEAGSQV